MTLTSCLIESCKPSLLLFSIICSLRDLPRLGRMWHFKDNIKDEPLRYTPQLCEPEVDENGGKGWLQHK